MNIFNKKEILVIGGVHIDILADYPLNDKHKTDKVGKISFSIGGTAFNLVSNLDFFNAKISLCTVLNKDSQFTPHIFYKLNDMNVSTEYVQSVNSDDLSAFVALREGGEMVSAVTNNIIEKFRLEYSMLEKAISEHELVVADCNLSSFHLADIIKICNYYHKPVVMSVVSDSKAERLGTLDRLLKVDLVSMNFFEAKVFFRAEDLDGIKNRILDNEFANFLTVVVTLGKDGFLVKTSSGKLLQFPATEVNSISSTTGAGDALLACIIFSKLKDKEIDWDKCNKVIGEYVRTTLDNPTASYNSLIFLNRIIKRRKKIKTSLIIAVISILVSVIIGIIQILLAAT